MRTIKWVHRSRYWGFQSEPPNATYHTTSSQSQINLHPVCMLSSQASFSLWLRMLLRCRARLMPHEASEVMNLKNAKKECNSRQHVVYCEDAEGICMRMDDASEYCVRNCHSRCPISNSAGIQSKKLLYHHANLEMFCCENSVQITDSIVAMQNEWECFYWQR